MAIQYSTALRNFLNNYGSLKEAITGGKMVLYQGTTPTDPDGAISGTALVTVTQASAARTAAIPARGSITFAGTIAVGDHLETLTVDGVSIISGVITSTGTSNTDFATAVAADINAYQGAGRRVKAWSSAGVVYLEASPQAGAVTWTVSHTIHDLADANWTVTNEDFGTTRTGVPWASGLLLGASSAGVIAKSGTWSGIVGVSGTANFFVIYGPQGYDGAAGADNGTADASPYHFCRIIGTCGTSGADYLMSSTSLAATATHTVDLGTVTLNEEV